MKVPIFYAAWRDEIRTSCIIWSLLLIITLGPLHTRAKIRDHEIVRAQERVSKGHPKTPPKSCIRCAKKAIRCGTYMRTSGVTGPIALAAVYRAMLKIEALIWISFWRALKFQLFNWRVGSNPKRQFKNTEMKYKTHIKLVRELYGICFQYNVKN